MLLCHKAAQFLDLTHKLEQWFAGNVLFCFACPLASCLTSSHRQYFGVWQHPQTSTTVLGAQLSKVMPSAGEWAASAGSPGTTFMIYFNPEHDWTRFLVTQKPDQSTENFPGAKKKISVHKSGLAKNRKVEYPHWDDLVHFKCKC